MATSEPFSQRDIVVLPFPYTDHVAQKRRPALVISKPWMAEECGLLRGAMITSVGNEGWASDISISNLTKAGLSFPFVIRPVKIATIEAGRILKKIGSIDQKEKKALRTALTKILI